jgi:hypothetical protein
MNGAELQRMMDTHELIGRAYDDPRLTVQAGGCDLRSFVVTVTWVLGWERPEGNAWERVLDLTGMQQPAMLWYVFSDDAPRYEPPRGDSRESCEAPGVRKPACGRRGYLSFRVTNPVDGTWRMARYCARHEAEAQAARTAERVLRASGTLPEPRPNRGGLLPCYVRWNWEERYAQARPGWKPPAAGICADDWEQAAGPKPPQPPRLSLIRGDGSGDEPPGNTRALTVVGDRLVPVP